MTFRAHTFKLFDALTGRKIGSHFDEVKAINNADFSASRSRRSELLNNILQHAVETTPYYSSYAHFSSLHDFPVIKKTSIQDNFNAFRSVTYLNKKHIEVATSGSTGVPFFLYQDSNKKARNSADTLYYLTRSNFNIGDRLYDIEVWRDINVNNPIKAWMQNLVYVDSSKFNDAEIEALLEKLKQDNSPICLMGFASAFERICKYLEASTIENLHHLNVKSIIVISEYMTFYIKQTLEKYFGVPVVSRYSNEELGIIAQQLPHDDTLFKINWASYFVEVLKMDSDDPAPPNQMGRIVITDLFNYCMPIIRYDTGDIGAFNVSYSESGPEPSFKLIEGRKMDAVYNTDGELVSSFLIYTKFYKFYHLLKQYQFLQTGKKSYLVKLNTHSHDFKHKTELIESIKADFGDDAEVRIELINEIPPLSSGKRKKVVNLLNGTS